MTKSNVTDSNYQKLKIAKDLENMLDEPTGMKREMKREVAMLIYNNKKMDIVDITEKYEDPFLHSCYAAIHSLVKNGIVEYLNGDRSRIVDDFVLNGNMSLSIDKNMEQAFEMLVEIEKNPQFN